MEMGLVPQFHYGHTEALLWRTNTVRFRPGADCISLEFSAPEWPIVPAWPTEFIPVMFIVHLFHASCFHILCRLILTILQGVAISPVLWAGNWPSATAQGRAQVRGQTASVLSSSALDVSSFPLMWGTVQSLACHNQGHIRPSLNHCRTWDYVMRRFSSSSKVFFFLVEKAHP